ncbi:MAG: FecR family protein [Bacteroidetes bacterium]|nr:FecR family protein [Bacteroidota bacterium]MBS1972865.1 FecR family protein [Bacteroidota bacterium]
MHQEHIWNLIAKKLSGESSPEELRELEELLRKAPELHYPIQTIMDLWNARPSATIASAHDKFHDHLERMGQLGIAYSSTNEIKTEAPATPYNNRKGKEFFLWSGLGLTTIIAVVLFAIYFLPPKKSNEPMMVQMEQQAAKPFNEIATKNGSKTNLILPDGTKVWLNAGSRLTYDSSYNKNIREVSLSGEGFFDVVKNKERPFIIHASNINIKVLGTEFNVRSYPNEKTTEAALIRGSIEVTFKNKPAKKIILKPNEKIIVENVIQGKETGDAGNNRPAKMKDIADEVAIKALTHEQKTGDIIETSWVENKLVFQDESFEDIARQLERWYGVTITFQNKQLKENHLTGSFKNETIRQALDALKFTAPFNYSIDSNNNIIIY